MKKTLLLIVSVISTISSFAQKSSPIIGDAAALIDLLKKDYSSVNPESRDEEIITDRGKVIAIFKSYLLDIQQSSDSQKKTLNAAKQAYIDYMSAKKAVNTISKINVNINVSNILVDTSKNIHKAHTEYLSIKDDLIQLQNNLKHCKIAYYEKKMVSDTIEFEKLKSGFKNNGYLFKMIDDFKSKFDSAYYNTFDNHAQNNTYASIQKSIPFVGGDLGFETIIDGLSRFLAKRIKEELTIHAIDKIKKYLENPTPENYCNELLVLLPTTTNYLKSFESHQLLNFTDEIKQYIEQDFNNLLSNAANLKNTPRLKNYIDRYPDLEFAFEGLKIIPQLTKIKSPIDYFEIIENSRCLAGWRSDKGNMRRFNIAQGIRLASMIAYSMTVVDNGETRFASVDMISNYGNELSFYYLYFGMLHQQNIKYFNVSFIPESYATPVTLNIKAMMDDYSKVTATSNIVEFLKANLTSIATNAEKIYTQGLALKKKNKNNEEIKYQEVYSFVNDFISFTEEVVTTSDLFFDDSFKFYSENLRNCFDLKMAMAPYFNLSRTANDMMLDLHQKKYSNAVIKAIEIPLGFRKGDDDLTDDLLNFSNQIKLNNDFTFISEIFDTEKFNKLNDKEKIKKLQQIRNKLEIFSIKISKVLGLTTLKNDCDTFNAYVQNLSTNPAVDSIDSQIERLKQSFKSYDTTLMEFEGISNTKFKEFVKKLFESNDYSSSQYDSIYKKVDGYLKNLFSKHVLNETTNTSIEEENIKYIINAFTPQFLNENSKINDNNAIKVIHFVNEMAGAKDAAEVEKAIDALALPVGSSSLKEKAFHYFSINAYPGLIGGIEYSRGQDRAASFGFTAPVGLYGQFFRWGNGKSLGAFVPIIDIGAPVRLRIDDNNDTKTLPDFNFSDIFSPGLYLSYGFGNKLPLAINFGVQYGPKLRDIPTATEGTFTSVESYRVSLAIVIDIPLLTISGKY